MKLVPIIMNYCLLQLDILNFFLGVRLHWEFVPNFNFFKVNPQIFQQNRKVHISDCLDTNFHNIFYISLSDIRRENYPECDFLKRKIFFLNVSAVGEESINIMKIRNAHKLTMYANSYYSIN